MGTGSLIIVLASGLVGMFGPIAFAILELKRGERYPISHFSGRGSADFAAPPNIAGSIQQNEVGTMGRKVAGIIMTVVGGLGLLAGLPMFFRGIFMLLSSGSSAGGLDGDIGRYVATRELFGGLIACLLFGLILAVGIWFLWRSRRLHPAGGQNSTSSPA